MRREFCGRPLHGSLTERSERKGITVKKEENPGDASIGDDVLTVTEAVTANARQFNDAI